MKSFRIGGLIPTLALAFVFTSATISRAAPTAPLETYQRADGQTYFALSLTAQLPDSQEGPADTVILFDTSASQTGVYRETALAALKTCLDKLGSQGRVQLLAVDLQARPLTHGFEPAESGALDTALAALESESPLGSTDMQQALEAAMARFDANSSAPRSVLYIGDGMSTANLLGTSSFTTLVDRLRAERVSVNSYAIGPQRDGRLLAALANQTGGNLYVDEPMAVADEASGITPERAQQENLRRGAVVGSLLADWTKAQVFWPQEVRWPAEMGDVYPQNVPPLRSDRDTVVVGTISESTGPVEIEVIGELAGQAASFTWTAEPNEVGDSHAFLAELVDTASRNGGVTLPTVGTAGLMETGRLINAGVENLTNLAQRAVATGDVESARLLSEAVLRRDPGNLRAQTVQRVVQRGGPAAPASDAAAARVAQAPPAPDELNLVRPAPGQSLPLPPPPANGGIDPVFPSEGALVDRFAEDGSFLSEAEQQKRVFAQMLRTEVNNTIDDARQIMSDDPKVASQRLKLALQSVERAPELNADIRAQLIDKLQSTLREVQNFAAIKDELDRAREEEIAAARERRMLIERIERVREREKQLMSRFNSLVDEERYAEAAEVAAVVEEVDPEGVAPRVATLWSRLKHHHHLQMVARAARHQAYFDTLYAVELSHIPTPDDPPIVYPDPEFWEDLTNRRKKYASVDLSAQGGAEQRIEEALASPLTSAGLDFVEAPLEEVVAFMKDEYNIPIQLDMTALDDLGIGADEPITVSLRNITLRSALRLMLKQLDLTYIVSDEVLQITTPEEAETRLTVKVYPVADLVIPIDPENLSDGGGGGLGGGGGGGGLGGGGGGLGGGGGGGGFGGGGGGLGGGGGGGGGGLFSVPDEAQNQSAASSDAPSEDAQSPAHESTRAASVESNDADDPVSYWDQHFSAARRDEAQVRSDVRRLMKDGKLDHVIALIQAALRHGQPQPWMYESLGIALDLDGRSKDQIERALMSAIDFNAEPDQLMYVANYLSRIGFDQRALQLYQQVIKVMPLRHEAYLLGLRTAQRCDDLAGVQWATIGILGQAWPHELSNVPHTAMRVARSTLDTLEEQGRTDEREAYRARLEEALLRDCVVRVSWTGDADVDLIVEEPSGSICSQAEPRTTAGGVALGDAFASADEAGAEGFAETYVCPVGFNGTYRVRLHRVWGEVAAGKVTVDIYKAYGSKNAQHERQQIELGEKDSVVLFDLDNGRRDEPLEAEQLAGAVRRQEAVRNAILAQQFNDFSDPDIIPTRPDIPPDEARRRRLALAGGGAVGFQPIIVTLPEGTNLIVEGVISADRRYVRVTALPIFSTIGDVRTFTFAGAAAQAEDEEGNGDGNGAGAGI